jgi:hypothetical protein
MTLSTLLASFIFLFAVHAVSGPLKSRDTAGVQWGSCAFNSTLPIECSNLTVPLDYSEPESSNTLELNLLKVPAAKQPVKGSILFNFGGPGVGCRLRLTQLAETLQA